MARGVRRRPDRRPGVGSVAMGITVAVTGPTGAIGGPAIAALERDPGVDRILGMARRPFDPAACGWTKTRYRQGDVLDRGAVDALVADADVVVHLAFLIMGSRAAALRVNVTGTRHVIEAAVAAPRTRRLVYTSSVAAYGYHADNPMPAHRGRAGARLPRALLLRAEGRVRGADRRVDGRLRA